MYEKYREDLPEFIRGRLDSGRAAEILRAAEQDSELREAIEQERTLERWLEYYEVPELGEGFERRFWNRFHDEKVASSTGRGAWMFKLIGPLAAGVLIAVGIILFVGNDEQPIDNGGSTAEVNDDAGVEDAGEEPVIEIEWDDSEFTYIAGGETPVEQRGGLDLETLELLKVLDDPAFLPLDELDRPDDMAVIDELELLTKLAEDE